MNAITETLEGGNEDYIEKLFPGGKYLAQIMKAEVLNGYWGSANRWFTAAVPSIKIVDSVPTGDPELDDNQLVALEVFGDWEGFMPPKGSGAWTMFRTVPGKEGRIRLAGISELNFVLADTTPQWKHKTATAKEAHRFFTPKNSQGEVGGWVINTLSASPNSYESLDITAKSTPREVLLAIEGAYLNVTLEWQQRNPEYPASLECTRTSRVG